MTGVRIVRVNESSYESLPSFEIPLKDFVEIVDESEYELVFTGAVRRMSDDAYFIVHHGVALYTKFVSVKSWDEFKNQYEKMACGGFQTYEDFSDAYDYGIESNEEYQTFTKSELYNSSDSLYVKPQQKKEIYARYVKLKNSGYKTLSDFNEASKLGIEEVKEYYLFKASEWAGRDRWRGSTPADFQNFKEAMKKGFTSKNDFNRATELGFLDAKTYGMFKESGLGTKEEFDYLLNVFPSIVENNLESINQIKSESDDAFNDGRHQESVQKDYLYVEKLLNLVYVALYKRKPENEIMYDEVLRDLNEKEGLEIHDVVMFTKCRRMRNDITHENYKVSVEEASDAKAYLEGLGTILTTYIKTTVENEFKN